MSMATAGLGRGLSRGGDLRKPTAGLKEVEGATVQLLAIFAKLVSNTRPTNNVPFYNDQGDTW